MSTQPGEELGSEGRWFGDDYERNGLFGNTPSRFEELREEFKPRGGEVAGDLDQQFHPFQDDGKRPPVAMETGSTDEPMSGLFRKSMNDDGDVYTSLMSNQSFTSGQEASYLSDDLKLSKPYSDSSALDHFSSDTYSFSSNTKMTSNLDDDMPKSLFGSDKAESYNYMDINYGDERSDQHSLVDTGSTGHDSLVSYMDKNHGRDEDEEEEEENLGPALGSHSFPYVEEPSDEELSDYRSYRNLGGTPQMASPVKITLTESKPPTAKTEPLQHPPPVIVPEQKEFTSQDMYPGKPAVSKSSASTKAGSREQDGSSAESGDSEVELVSEEPSKATSNPFSQPPKSKSTSSQPNNPFDNPPAKSGFGLVGNHAPPTAYSILREEREAELDSDLFIESASEESPKREQGFSGPKQGVSPPSPLAPSATPPRSTAEAMPTEPLIAEKVKTPMKTDEDRPSKPKPPTAAVPPEVRSERPHQDDMHKHTNEGRGDLGKPATSTILQGFDKQKEEEGDKEENGDHKEKENRDIIDHQHAGHCRRYQEGKLLERLEGPGY
ncbi:hypothetical protein FQN60_008932 [Etheostoma spectabile]|uniref:Uncharacterized protein n=1 Tax=Etheostoma spectabile TaxID=54343 RepID=A0A5J5CK09_9PERO|nr:hypothetical protein FQN60_008932 [Etheostoma spectabile]